MHSLHYLRNLQQKVATRTYRIVLSTTHTLPCLLGHPHSLARTCAPPSLSCTTLRCSSYVPPPPGSHTLIPNLPKYRVHAHRCAAEGVWLGHRDCAEHPKSMHSVGMCVCVYIYIYIHIYTYIHTYIHTYTHVCVYVCVCVCVRERVIYTYQ
jgi:hypothetical protein